MTLALILLLLAVSAAALWWFENQLGPASGFMPMQWNKKYEFYFSTLFKTEAEAMAAVEESKHLGLASRVSSPSEQNSNWAVSWTLFSKPRRLKVVRVQQQIELFAKKHNSIGTVHINVFSGAYVVGS